MPIVVFITAKDIAQAKKLARALVARNLVACVNVVKGVESFFWWEGRVENAKEALLILKTTRVRFNDIVKITLKLHSYSVPEIIALEVVAGEKKYLKWVEDSVCIKKKRNKS